MRLAQNLCIYLEDLYALALQLLNRCVASSAHFQEKKTTVTVSDDAFAKQC